MSYAPQWPTNVTPHGISPNQVSPQGEILQNSASMNHNGVLYGAFNPNTLRQHASQLHIPMGSTQPGAVRGALLSSHAFQMAHPGSHNISPGPYIPTPNGLQLAAFSAGITSPPGITNPSMCSFAHPSMQHASQQQPNSLGPVQFRSYDSLKHFGALPHPQLAPVVFHSPLPFLVASGSGFIDCVSEEDAIKALNHLSELARSGGRKLNNLPRTGFTKETLENLFRPYGQVTSVKLLETDGNYTGIGFVRFASAEQAQRAVESMNEARCVLADSPGGG
ncbi:unnamed protein product, partial [Dibothriocephalus latus]